MNREQELNKQFPLEDGTTYIQSLDKSNETANFMKWMHENDTPENAEKYFHYSNEDMFNEYLKELKGAGAGGESIKENFIDSKIKQMNKPKVTIDELHTFLTNVIELKVGIRRKIVALKDFINKIESDSSPNSLDSNKSDEQSKSASVDSSDKRDIDFMYKWIRKHSNK